jgi:hypothetical protein
VADASKTAAAGVAGSWDAAVAGSTKILKWGSIIGAVVGYEGVKKFLTYNQQVTQLGINAGLSAKQLPALAAGFMKISDATGMSATNVANMAYYLASANPALKTSTSSLLAMTNQAAELNVLAGNSANPTAESKAYGAIVSNQLSLTAGGKALTYSAASGKAINEWINAVTGHGDITVGGVSAAMGTGLLSIAKTFGIPLNTVGAWLDVLTPAMGATSASTRLKTAIGMLAAPSAKASEGFELFGGNITTAASTLRSKGGAALLSYLNTLTTGRVTGSTFASAFYGGGLGTITGGTKGVGSGAGEYLRVLGFTPAQASVMESAGGIASFAKMTTAQLAGMGFAKGTTGTEAEKSVQSAIIGGMFGGGHTGAAIMQLMNESATATAKQTGIVAGENPKTYGSELALAFAEPIVTFRKLEQAAENLTIRVGGDVTPALETFGKELLAVGSWFGKNKGALAALGILAGSIVAGAAVIKTISVGEKLASGVKYLIGGSSTAGLSGNTGALTLNTGALQELTGKLALTPGGGIVPGGAGGATTTEEELGGASILGGKSLTAFLRGSAFKVALGAAALWGYNSFAEPYLKKHLTSQEDRTANDVVHDAIVGATIGNIVPGLGTLFGGTVGGIVGAVASLNRVHQNPYQKLLTAYYSAHANQLGPGYERAGIDVTSATGFRQMAAGMGMPAMQIRSDVLATTAYNRSHPTVAGALPAATGWSPTAVYARTHIPGVVAQQAQEALAGRVAGTMGVSSSTASAFVSSLVAASKLKGTAAQDTGAKDAEISLVAAAVEQKDAADHFKMSTSQLTDTAKQYAATLARLITSASEQTTAANTTQTAANNLNSSAAALAAAALDLKGAAAVTQSALSPANIHNTAVAGTKQAVARK